MTREDWQAVAAVFAMAISIGAGIFLLALTLF